MPGRDPAQHKLGALVIGGIEGLSKGARKLLHDIPDSAYLTDPALLPGGLQKAHASAKQVVAAQSIAAKKAA